jgi:hypothetical protein
MPSYQVICITRDTSDPDYRIDAVGFDNGEVYLIDAVIDWLNQSDENKLWVEANGTGVWVGVRQHPTSGRLYLTTEPDGYPLNNLASLREC